MIIIIIALLALLIIWGVSVQNTLVKADETCNNALKQINVQQMSRYDAIQALVKLTREYSQYESETLQKVIEARGGMISKPNPTVEDIAHNESILTEISSKLIAVAEAYPDLKANEQYAKTMDQITKYEENVRMARMTFNDTVTRYNNQVRMFPGSVVAKILGFVKKEYLAEDTTKTEYPQI